MTRRQRVAENLNSALHHLLGAHPGTYLIGEDVADPYGGAFKVTRGLSDRFPDRVLSSVSRWRGGRSPAGTGPAPLPRSTGRCPTGRRRPPPATRRHLRARP